MKLSRREFTGHLAGGAAMIALGGMSLSLEGCSALSELETWVPVGIAGFDGVAGIVDGPFTAIATTVDALWAAVQAAINNYQNGTDPTVTKLDKVIAALDALSSGLTQALTALPISIPAAVLSAAKLALALIISTLKSIRNKLRPAPTPPAMAAAIGTMAPAKNKQDFVNRFNQIMAANGQSLRIQ